jgi:carboxymethylenebutenolidase
MMVKTSRLVKSVLLIVMAILSLSVGGRRLLSIGHVVQPVLAAEKSPKPSAISNAFSSGAMPLGLPSEDTAKASLDLSIAYHHPQWLDVPMGATKIHTFVIYPTLAGKAPVVVVAARNQGLSDWARAVGTEVVKQGYVAVVPDLLSGLGPNGGGTYSFANNEAVAAAFGQLSTSEIERRTEAVRAYFTNQPGSNGKSAVLDFNWSENQLAVAISAPPQNRVIQFDLSEHAWHSTLAVLASLAEPGAMPQADSAMPKPKDNATETASAARERAAAQEIAKRTDIVPGHFGGPMKEVEQSPRHGQWISIPVKLSTGMVKMRTWLVEPLGNEKAGVVVVIQPAPGMDIGEAPRKGLGANWLRAVSDQLALQGFIAVLPDLSSGLAPNGGDFDSFHFADDVAKALTMRSNADKMEMIRAARDYGLKLPRANGKSGTTGFCSGGGQAWESSADMPGVNASVSFYGAPPDAATMAKIQAPVLAFVGDDDPGLAPRVAGAAPDMQRLGKVFEFTVYPNVTHAFLEHQTLGENAYATLDAWPRAIAFFKKYMNAQTSSANTSAK